MHFVNEADKVVTQHLQEGFVNLRHWRLAPNLVAELPLHRAEGGFDVAAPVIEGEKFFAVQTKKVEQTRPDFRTVILADRRRVAFERNHGLNPLSVKQFKIRPAAIGFVGRDLFDIEVGRRFGQQDGHRGGITGRADGRFSGRDDVRPRADHRVKLDELPAVLVPAVFGAVVPVEVLRSESRRVHGEVVFECLERQGATRNQSLEDAAGREGLELSAWLRQLALRAAGVLPMSR